jgi:hypothetical protein
MDIEAIKQAAAAVMPCTWTVRCEETPDKAAAKNELSLLIDQTGPFIGKMYHLAANGKCVATTGCGPNSEAHANYLHSINPVAVAKLVSELETLQEENAELIIGISRLSEDEELLQETTDSDMISVVKLAARLAEAEERARSFEAEANQLREVSQANRHRSLVAATQIEYLRTTMQVFAGAANEYDTPDDNGPWPDNQDVLLSLGDVRRAREALILTGGYDAE